AVGAEVDIPAAVKRSRRSRSYTATCRPGTVRPGTAVRSARDRTRRSARRATRPWAGAPTPHRPLCAPPVCLGVVGPKAVEELHGLCGPPREPHARQPNDDTPGIPERPLLPIRRSATNDRGHSWRPRSVVYETSEPVLPRQPH